MCLVAPSLEVEAELFDLDRELARRGQELGDDAYWIYQLASSRGHNALCLWLHRCGSLPAIRALLNKVRLAAVPLPELRRAARQHGMSRATRLGKYELMTVLAQALTPEELTALGQPRRRRGRVHTPSSSLPAAA